MLIFILLLLLFFICWCSSFTFLFQDHSSPFRGLSPGFQTHFVLSDQPIAERFATLLFFNHSVMFLPRALRLWVGIFYPQAFFTLCSFPTFLTHSQHFGTTCFYQGFTGFTLIHNLLYILSLYLCRSILQRFYLWWKLW